MPERRRQAARNGCSERILITLAAPRGLTDDATAGSRRYRQVRGWRSPIHPESSMRSLRAKVTVDAFTKRPIEGLPYIKWLLCAAANAFVPRPAWSAPGVPFGMKHPGDALSGINCTITRAMRTFKLNGRSLPASRFKTRAPGFSWLKALDMRGCPLPQEAICFPCGYAPLPEPGCGPTSCSYVAVGHPGQAPSSRGAGLPTTLSA